MSEPTITDEELARHFGHHREGALFGNPIRQHCRVCNFTWPCPTARLIAALRAERAEVARLRDELAVAHRLANVLHEMVEP